MLWTVLNDVRLLMLRMAYGEALNADCGGGSLPSNTCLLFYQLFLADMFTNDAEHDCPETAQHARVLSGGFLAAVKIVSAQDYDGAGTSAGTALLRGIADASPMAALTCILYHNNRDEQSVQAKEDLKPHPRRRWELNKEAFLCGLIACAGRRHALGVDESGCVSSRNRNSSRSSRPSSFADWEILDGEPTPEDAPSSPQTRKATTTSVVGSRGLPKMEDFAKALRPMITLYAILDELSAVFVLNMSDESVEQSAARVVKKTEDCHGAKSITELLRKANVSMDHDRIIEELQKGMISA